MADRVIAFPRWPHRTIVVGQADDGFWSVWTASKYDRLPVPVLAEMPFPSREDAAIFASQQALKMGLPIIFREVGGWRPGCVE